MALTDYTSNPLPWYHKLIYQDDLKYHGMFCLLRTHYNLSSVPEQNHAKATKEFFDWIKLQLQQHGIIDWLNENDIGLQSCHVSVLLDPGPWQLRVVVLIDLPKELRTMYTLRFKGEIF